MKKRVCIDFACNDPDNGEFAGLVSSATYGDIELEAPTEGGFRLAVGDRDDFIRIHRRTFRIIGRRYWNGNWCWDQFVLSRSEAKKLLGAMRKNGWRCTLGPSRFYEWWNQQ